VPEGPLVSYHGRPVAKLAGSFQRLREGAGFGPDVTCYTLRHTVATELSARGVPELQIATLLGHRAISHRTTGRYLHARPEHLGAAREALDALAADIGRAAARSMHPETPPTCEDRVRRVA
jgi:integrase